MDDHQTETCQPCFKQTWNFLFKDVPNCLCSGVYVFQFWRFPPSIVSGDVRQGEGHDKDDRTLRIVSSNVHNWFSCNKFQWIKKYESKVDKLKSKALKHSLEL